MMTGSSGFEEAVCTFDFEIMRPSYLVMLCIASIGGLCFVRSPPPPPAPLQSHAFFAHCRCLALTR